MSACRPSPAISRRAARTSSAPTRTPGPAPPPPSSRWPSTATARSACCRPSRPPARSISCSTSTATSHPNRHGPSSAARKGRLKLQAVAASLGVAALLADAAAARGQGAGGPASEAQPIRQTLAEHGVRPALVYDAEGFADLSGGARRGATYLANLNLLLALDMERLAGWRGATVFVDGLAIHGGRPSGFSGDAQGVSSIEAAHEWTLEEAWIQQNLFGNRFSALVGLYDVNGEFYHLHAADLFLNASFGMAPELSQRAQGGPVGLPAYGGRCPLRAQAPRGSRAARRRARRRSCRASRGVGRLREGG